MSPRWLVDPAAVALGTVAPEQRELARNLLTGDPEFRRAVEERRSILGLLEELPEDAWTPATDVPPLDVDAVIDGPAPPPAREPAPEPATPDATTPRVVRWNLRAPAMAAAAVLLLLIGGLGGALIRGGGAEGGPAPGRSAPAADTDPWVLANLKPVATGTGSATAAGRVALTLQPGGRIRLNANGLRPNPAGTFYEAWLLTDTDRMVALGTFRVGADGRASAEFRTGADPRDYRYVDVSLQHASEGPGHSGDSVLRSSRLS